MNSVTNTREFYEVLTACHIPVIYDDGTARSLHNIVCDLLYLWKGSSQRRRSMIEAALEYLGQDGYAFSPAQSKAIAAIFDMDPDDLEIFGNPDLDGYFVELHGT